MFKKTILIITSTIFIAQLASFYEQSYISSTVSSFNKPLNAIIYKDHKIYKENEIKDKQIRKTSPRIYSNSKLAKKDNYVYMPLCTLLTMKSSSIS